MPENNSFSEFFKVNLTEIVFPELSEYRTFISPLSCCVVVSCNVLRSFDCKTSLAEVPSSMIVGSFVISVGVVLSSCGMMPSFCGISSCGVMPSFCAGVSACVGTCPSSVTSP